MAKNPKISTIRKYYPSTKLTDYQIMHLRDFVVVHMGVEGISPTNKLLACLMDWEETRPKDGVMTADECKQAMMKE